MNNWSLHARITNTCPTSTISDVELKLRQVGIRNLCYVDKFKNCLILRFEGRILRFEVQQIRFESRIRILNSINSTHESRIRIFSFRYLHESRISNPNLKKKLCESESRTRISKFSETRILRFESRIVRFAIHCISH